MDALQEMLRELSAQLSGLQLGLLGRLLLASVLGGLVGWERERSGKPAGLRTNMLICLGAALLGDVSIHFAGMVPTEQVRNDPARIAAQVVSGIGFLGAGTIIQARGSVIGLTTAATLWVVAAIGLAVGGGNYVAAVGTAALVLVALLPLGWLEDRVQQRHGVRSFQVVATFHDGVVMEVEDALGAAGLDVDVQQVTRDLRGGTVTILARVRGSREKVRAGRRAVTAREWTRKVVIEME